MLADHSEKKKVTFVTHAPQGTLGDASATAKLVRSLKEKYGNELNVEVVMIVDDIYVKQAASLFVDLARVRCSDRLAYTDSHIAGYSGIEARLRESDAVVLFPTSHFLSSTDFRALENIANKAHFFKATEYNFDTEYDKWKHAKEGHQQVDMTAMVSFDTGLGEGKQGIFIGEEKASAASLSSSAMRESQDASFFKMMLGDECDLGSYQKDHDLYFGYFNRIPGDAGKNLITPAQFARVCVASSDKKAIDIVMPVIGASDSRVKKNFGKHADDVIAELGKVKDITDYRIEFYEKSSTGEMSLSKSHGSGDKVIRVINPYPIVKESMKRMFAISDSLTMVTGDQSLSEAISNEKLFVYQTMAWKTLLAQSLQDQAAIALGKEAVLPRFLAMQFGDKDGDINLDEKIKFIKENRQQLQEEMRKFTMYILKNQNLHENLPKVIHELVVNDSLYLEKLFLNFNFTLSNVCKIQARFPEDFNIVYDVVAQGLANGSDQERLKFFADLVELDSIDKIKFIGALPKPAKEYIQSFIQEYIGEGKCDKNLFVVVKNLVSLFPEMKDDILKKVCEVHDGRFSYDECMVSALKDRSALGNEYYHDVVQALCKPEFIKAEIDELDVGSVLGKLKIDNLNVLIDYLKMSPELSTHIVNYGVKILTEGMTPGMSFVTHMRDSGIGVIGELSQLPRDDQERAVIILKELIDNEMITLDDRVRIISFLTASSIGAVVKDSKLNPLIQCLCDYKIDDKNSDEYKILALSWAIEKFLKSKNVESFHLKCSLNGSLSLAPLLKDADDGYSVDYTFEECTTEWAKIFKGTPLEKAIDEMNTLSNTGSVVQLILPKDVNLDVLLKVFEAEVDEKLVKEPPLPDVSSVSMFKMKAASAGAQHEKSINEAKNSTNSAVVPLGRKKQP